MSPSPTEKFAKEQDNLSDQPPVCKKAKKADATNQRKILLMSRKVYVTNSRKSHGIRKAYATGSCKSTKTQEVFATNQRNIPLRSRKVYATSQNGKFLWGTGKFPLLAMEKSAKEWESLRHQPWKSSPSLAVGEETHQARAMVSMSPQGFRASPYLPKKTFWEITLTFLDVKKPFFFGGGERAFFVVLT